MQTRKDLATNGRRGAFTQHSLYDVRETTAAARAAMAKKFEDQVDPEPHPPRRRARERRVTAAKRAYFIGLGQKSAQARRSRNASPDSASQS